MLENIFDWKSKLLCRGCRINEKEDFSPSIAVKKIHLYAHSEEKMDRTIPDDVLLPDGVSVRVRYQSSSPFILESVSGGYQIRNEMNEEVVPVNFVKLPNFSNQFINNIPVSSICSFLGQDLLGITPSNYCFYFQQKKQCRFCEILPTFKKEVDYPKTFKSLDVIEESILSALKNEPRLRFIAITTGNIQSYDATFDYFSQIGLRLQKHSSFQKIEQVLATLMPPDDFSKIELLKNHGFTKIYFPLEVFDRSHFKVVCPGKNDYGYDKIIDALKKAVQIFGQGNVYTNFVYGIQSLNVSLDGSTYNPLKENELAIEATTKMLGIGVIPAFTLYHYGGYNQIGKITLDTLATSIFFKEWGKLVDASQIIAKNEESVIFSPYSLTNTLFNDGFRLARQKEAIWM